MAMNVSGWKRVCSVPVAITVCFAFTLGLGAQVETKTAATEGHTTYVTNVERGEVVAVSGDDLIVKMSDGSMRNIEDVPESARVTVDGKQLGLHDLQPGMKLERTITTATTPMTITTVQSVRGKVWHINPPLTIILTLENGQNQQFKIPKDQKFNVDGQMLDAWGVRKGMTVTATKIVQEPAVVMTHQKTVTGQAAPKAAEVQPIPPPDVPILIAEGSEVPVPAPTATTEPGATPAAGTEPAATPEAASHFSTMWLIVLLGLLVLAGAIGWNVVKKNRVPDRRG
jgi:hypothetical protein